MPRIMISGGANPQFRILSQDAINAGKTFDNAGPLDLLFDGTSGGIYPGIFTSGILYSSAGWTYYDIGNGFFGQFQVRRHYYQVNFGKTFDSPPQVIYALRPAGDVSWGITPRYSHVDSGSWSIYNYASNSYVVCRRRGCAISAITYTTHAIFAFDYVPSSGAGHLNWDISYIVFQS